MIRLTLGLILLGSIAHSYVLILSDFDGTLVEHRKLKTNKDAIGAYQTPHILQRREMSLLDIPAGQEEVDLSPRFIEVNSHEFEELHDRLHKGGQYPSKNGRTPFTLSDGTKIIPDHYQMTDATFDYFGQSPDPKRNYLIEQFKTALAEEKKSGRPWQGPYYDFFREALKLKARGENIQIGTISARGHSQKEWTDFFKVFAKEHKGEKLAMPDFFYTMTRAADAVLEYLAPTYDVNIAKRKARKVREILLELDKVPLEGYGTEDVDINTGRGKQLMHSVVLIDDNQEVIKEYYEMIKKLQVAKELNKVKVVIANAGLKSDIKASDFPASFVVTRDGTVRKAVADELVGGLMSLDPNMKLESCLYGVERIVRRKR